MTPKLIDLIKVLEFVDIEQFVPSSQGLVGPTCEVSRTPNLARAFVAKAVLDLPPYQDGGLAFALEAGGLFTNNQAERDLHSIKVKPKVSGGFRTKEGACIHARLQAVISTFRKRGERVFTWLARAIFTPSYSSHNRQRRAGR